ncbi:MAG TPA: hypothetical protein VMM76_14295 [Pirellulaceae bacterium]|nr:hypothetical protein [Pirellulaceae bacterium]
MSRYYRYVGPVEIADRVGRGGIAVDTVEIPQMRIVFANQHHQGRLVLLRCMSGSVAQALEL